VALLVLVALSKPAWAATEAAEVEKARVAYAGKNYAEAERKITALLESGKLRGDVLLLAQARMVLGASLVLQSRDAEASKVFEELLTDDGQYDPDPLTYPTKVLEIYIDTRDRMRERLVELAKEEARKAQALKEHELNEKRKRDARLKLLERLASQETLVYRNSRSLAMLPFGIGQFQNRSRNWGWFFLGSEAALLVGSVAVLPFYLDAESSKNAALATDRRLAEAYRVQGNTLRGVNIALAAGFFLTWAAGAIEAQATYVPEFRETRPRPLPSMTGQWTPRLEVLKTEDRFTGATLSISGRY
jgi:hypothetical protein